MSNTGHRQLHVIDSHTGGEPTRVVVGLPDGLEGLDHGSLVERREILRREHDWIRSSCINEPRGHDAMVGALLCEPVNPECVAGVIFFNNVGYLGGCIHGTIGLTTTLAHMGRISAGKHRIETPVGEVVAELHEDGSVTVANVPSYRYQKEVVVDVPDFGQVVGDIAWGGNWFFLVDVKNLNGVPEVIPGNIAELTHFSAAIAHALADHGITGDDGSAVDHVEIFGRATPGMADSRSFVLCPGLEYDRSPCGTGVSAKLACLYADGQLDEGQIWRQASILNTVFDGRVVAIDKNRVIPFVTGSAFVNGEATIILQDNDPFQYGITSN
ncbi:MAG: proline racemase family protein [Verrucomicrobiae bacterium]|nr:proline racemase family protein [Verrucomicrobiae bacterium]NNJ86552.1 hydroxyproline-2-epimerase [Akkermansiaceae bacterium]